MTIYLKEINGKLIELEKDFLSLDVDLIFQKGYKPYDEADYALYLIGAKTYLDGSFVDIQTEEYNRNQTIINKKVVQEQINELDLKSIRALREGGVKNNSTGEDWLAYYTKQIANLRKQLSEL